MCPLFFQGYRGGWGAFGGRPFEVEPPAGYGLAWIRGTSSNLLDSIEFFFLKF
jgi:hypothetical protein